MLELSQYDTLGPVNITSPVNKNHSLNRGLVSWWLCLPSLMGGQYWYDLMGVNKGTLTTMGNASNGWRSTPRQGGFGQMLFDGTAGCVDCGTLSNIKGISQLTISMWVYRSTSVRTIGTGMSVAGSQTAIGMEGYTNGSLYLFANGSLANYGVFGGSWTGWHHVVMVFDGTLTGNTNRLKGYLDGLQQSVSFAGTLPTTTFNSTTTNFFIGKIYDGGNVFTNGNQDDVRVWNRALLASEIQAVYNESKAGYPYTLNRLVSQGELYQNPINTGFKGINIRQTPNELVFRTNLLDAWGNKITSGPTTYKIYEVQSDGALRSYDFAKNQFTSDKLVQETAQMTQQKGNLGRTDTGIWTDVINTNYTTPVFVPNSIRGLMVWLKADAITGLVDGSNVTTWNDSGPNANNASVTATHYPVYKVSIQNGLPVVRFAHTDDTIWGTFSTAGATGWTFFTVVQTSANTTDSGQMAVWGTGSAGGTTGIRWAGGIGSSTSDGLGWAGPGSNTNLGSGIVNAINKFYIRTYVYNYSYWYMYSNGGQLAPPVADTSVPTGTFTYTVGGEAKTASVVYELAGDIGEHIIYNSALSNDNRIAVETYLRNKWGI